MALREQAVNLLRKPLRILEGLGYITRMVKDPALSQSYWPEERRKSKPRIFLELLTWLIRHRDVNYYYYTYGFDRKDGVRQKEFIARRTLNRIRDRKNLHPKQHPGHNYVCLVRDKFLFSQLLGSLGLPVVKNIAFCDADSFTPLETMNPGPLHKLVDGGVSFDAFCKKLRGGLGDGVFPLRLVNGRLFVDDNEITLEQLRARLNERYLIQERVQQHPRLAALHPASVNTLRITTFNNDGRIELVNVALKIGTAGQKIDNWAGGGVFVGVDIATARLRDTAYYKYGMGGRIFSHPQTGIVFAGYELPFLREAIDAVATAHRYLYGIHSLGWDVAIGLAGPIMIEANDEWGGGIPQSLERNFREKFLSMYRE